MTNVIVFRPDPKPALAALQAREGRIVFFTGVRYVRDDGSATRLPDLPAPPQADAKAHTGRMLA